MIYNTYCKHGIAHMTRQIYFVFHLNGQSLKSLDRGVGQEWGGEVVRGGGGGGKLPPETAAISGSKIQSTI